MTGNVIISSMADQGSVSDYVADLVVSSRGAELESLTALNKSASNYYLQLFNLPFDPGTARNVTNSVNANGALTLVGHKLKQGDLVTTAGAIGVADKYVREQPASITGAADTFFLYDTLAHALAGGATGLLTPADGTLGTIVMKSAADAPCIPEELPLLGTGSAPANILSYLNARFVRGLYVRAVTVQNASITGAVKAGNDVKFVARYRHVHGV